MLVTHSPVANRITGGGLYRSCLTSRHGLNYGKFRVGRYDNSRMSPTAQGHRPLSAVCRLRPAYTRNSITSNESRAIAVHYYLTPVWALFRPPLEHLRHQRVTDTVLVGKPVGSDTRLTLHRSNDGLQARLLANV